MKQLFLLAAIALLLISCSTARYPVAESRYQETTPSFYEVNKAITQSLFNDKDATISEENIQKILDGKYKLPEKLKIAMVRLDNSQSHPTYYWDEGYMKAQQSYLDLFTQKFQESDRVTNVIPLPNLLISTNPNFLNIREAAVRTQADLVAIYSINSEIYSKTKIFSGTDLKAFATIQFIILDVRTGLIPFSTIVTKDYLSRKEKEDFDDLETINRIKNEAVLLTIAETGNQLTNFLNNKTISSTE